MHKYLAHFIKNVYLCRHNFYVNKRHIMSATNMFNHKQEKA